MTEPAGPAHADRAGASRRRSIITITVVCLLLFFAFWYALSYYQASRGAPAPPTARPTTTCIDPSDVRVSVLNGTRRDGLAAGVAGQLKKRGFVVEKVANNPDGQDVSGVGLLRYPKSELPKVSLVAEHVGKLTREEVAKQPTITLVLGKGFTELPAAPEQPVCD